MNSYSILMATQRIQVLLDEAAARRVHRVEKRGLFKRIASAASAVKAAIEALPTTASRSSRRSTTIRTGAEASSLGSVRPPSHTRTALGSSARGRGVSAVAPVSRGRRASGASPSGSPLRGGCR